MANNGGFVRLDRDGGVAWSPTSAATLIVPDMVEGISPTFDAASGATRRCGRGLTGAVPAATGGHSAQVPWREPTRHRPRGSIAEPPRRPINLCAEAYPHRCRITCVLGAGFEWLNLPATFSTAAAGARGGGCWACAEDIRVVIPSFIEAALLPVHGRAGRPRHLAYRLS